MGIEISLVRDNAFLVYGFCIRNQMFNMKTFVRILFEIFHQCSYKQRVVENEVVFIGVIIATK